MGCFRLKNIVELYRVILDRVIYFSQLCKIVSLTISLHICLHKFIDATGLKHKKLKTSFSNNYKNEKSLNFEFKQNVSS